MTLKILLDPILTTRAPSSCSTYIQFYTFVTGLLEKRSDVFFTWILPEFVSDEDAEWMPMHPNIRYVRLPHHRDRMIEYVSPTRGLLDLVSFDGPCWDYDVLLTVRTGMVPMLKMNALSPRQKALPYTKQVWVIEEMPLMGFKKSVAMVNPDAQDLYTLAGYATADRVFIISYHEKSQILQAARGYFPPSQVRNLDDKIEEVVPVQKEGYYLKDPEAFYVPGQGKKFCIAYVGRMMAAQSNLDKIYSAMTNQWIWHPEDSVRLLALTPSTGGSAAWPPDHIEVQTAPREEFWRIAREEMHVLTIMHEDGGFSLSLIEPMMLGTPAIVLRAPWAVQLLGQNYPFFVKSELELYTLLKAFYEDYQGMYERYAAYFEEVFVPMFKDRFQNDLLYTRLEKAVDEENLEIPRKLGEKFANSEPNGIVQEILKMTAGLSEYRIMDVLGELGSSGVLKTLQHKLSEKDREVRGMVWKTPWNDLRLRLKVLHGHEDASPDLGHTKIPAENCN